jgi:hypothetical protein
MSFVGHCQRLNASWTCKACFLEAQPSLSLCSNELGDSFYSWTTFDNGLCRQLDHRERSRRVFLASFSYWTLYLLGRDHSPIQDCLRGLSCYFEELLPILILMLNRGPSCLDSIISYWDISNISGAFSREFAWRVFGVDPYWETTLDILLFRKDSAKDCAAKHASNQRVGPDGLCG